MTSNPRLRLNLLALSLSAALAGCGKAAPRAEVIGRLTLNGNPVEQAQVVLSANSLDRKHGCTYSAAVVDGSFQFPKLRRLKPGEYDVFVQPAEEDPEVVFERLRAQRVTALAQRDQFHSAVARKGPIRVELSAEDVNIVSIQLSTR